MRVATKVSVTKSLSENIILLLIYKSTFPFLHLETVQIVLKPSLFQSLSAYCGSHGIKYKVKMALLGEAKNFRILKIIEILFLAYHLQRDCRRRLISYQQEWLVNRVISILSFLFEIFSLFEIDVREGTIMF